MNREILFKAKRIDNGEWVEGCIVIDQSRLDRFKYRIQPIESGVLYAHPIDPDALCQYTGLTDKNGKKIWENDIVELPDEEGYFTCKWEEDAARFVMNGDGLTVDFDNYWSYQTEVAGNIFDNPELLEVE
ncbi:YopX family protein [Mediterraneibacter gnavus]|uniref:YopX family protein n=1 Tax=Mediterraneibacter gnavus TaxID=33038 RepID=UPI000463D743|nr:YopX family protein [Mediterraneibacter gnavus]